MNAEAAQALYEAERKGVKQAVDEFIVYSEGPTAKCALAVLGWKSEDAARYLEMKWGFDASMTACPLCGEACGGEPEVVMHLNDDHGLTFSEIARKLGPDSV